MLDFSRTDAGVLSDARIVTPDGIFEGAIAFKDGRIDGLSKAAGGRSLGGAFVIPGIVDIHTDHVERHTHPRVGVIWPFLPALLAHDAVIV